MPEPDSPEDGRLRQLSEMVNALYDGDPEPLGKEIDAMRAMLLTWSKECGDRKEYVLAMVAAMLADLAYVVYFDLYSRSLRGEDDPEPED